jgi:hypothetical protein
MAIAVDGGHSVPGPPCRPTRYGLASVADETHHEDDEWARGLEWDELACGYDLGVLSGQCPPLLEAQTKVAGRGFGTNYADAFTVYAGWECSTGALRTGEAWDNAEELLRRNWWKALERTLWTGLDQDGEQVRSSLAFADGVADLTPSAGALDLTSAVAALEDYASDCDGCEPVVHAHRGLGVRLAERGLIQEDGDKLRIKGTGSLFVPGAGYGRTGPGGVAPDAGESWIYVTGSVAVHDSPAFFTPERGDAGGAVNMSVNDITVFAERFAAIQVGCCVGAVLTTLCSCCC